jgi:hypothetical protein
MTSNANRLTCIHHPSIQNPCRKQLRTLTQVDPTKPTQECSFCEVDVCLGAIFVQPYQTVEEFMG